MSGTTAQDETELTKELRRCKTGLVTQKELLIGSVTRSKQNIRDFKRLEEIGLSTRKLGLCIEENYEKLVTELGRLVEEWCRYIRLSVLAKEPQPRSAPDIEVLKIEISDQSKQIDEYKEMVNQIKFENLDIFTKIEMSSKIGREEHITIKESKLNKELRPPLLTVNTNFMETKMFLRQFSTYVKSGESQGDLIFEVAKNNVDSFWQKMFEGWSFNEQANLQDFSFMVNSIAKKRFSINDRREELFNIKQVKGESPLDFIKKIKELIENSDWYGISQNEAICLFFEKGVRCSKSKNICYKYMEKHPEGDFETLIDLIKCALSPEKQRENCTKCGQKGHSEINCWGNCPVCGELGHRPGSCELSPEKIRSITKKKQKRKKREKIRKLKRKTQLPEQESSGQYWAESLSDSETVIEKEDSSGETSEEEEDMSEGVKRVKEVIGDATLEDISAAIKNIKKAKENDNSTMGMISKTTDFRKAKMERLLMDSGAQVCIMGETMALENKLEIKSLKKPKNVHEASGRRLDIIGTADMWVKIGAVKSIKRLRCLILRGSGVDREILVSCKMLKRWGLLHHSFPHETIEDFCNRKFKVKSQKTKTAAVFNKSPVSSNDKIQNVPDDCQKLRKKILKKHSGIFKDKLGKLDRVNLPPVKLHLDETNDEPPSNVGRPYDIPYHLRGPAQEEFEQMIEAGILIPNDEPSNWRSQAFPRMKPGSDPPKCRWVTDFRKLNSHLKRPIWGAESSSQILRRVDPEARYFACFDATSGFHQIRVCDESSKLMTVVTQYGTYRYTVLGQGICSSQDLFNWITDGGTKLDKGFNVLKNIDDFCIFAKTLEELEMQIDKLADLCRKINLKLSPSKFTLSTSVKFGGTIISAEKVADNSVIFLDPPDSRILAVTEMQQPESTKDIQKLMGMISSLQAWYPNINFATKALWGATSNKSKFIWTPEMNEEFQKIKIIFTDQIRLSPFNPDREINILIDAAKTKGVGYCFFQYVDDNDPEGEVTIVNANSSALKDNQLQFSAIDCEILGLKFAVDSNTYYLYGAKSINIITDANTMEGVFQKNIADIENKRIQHIVTKLMCYNFKFKHIPGTSNKIADCFSRLTRRIREIENIEIDEPILADHATIKKVGRKSNVQIEDPWVERLANVASKDIKYQIMVQQIETGEEFENIQKLNDCELSSMGTYYDKLSVCTLKDGQSLILKNNLEILVPENERTEILGLAHAANHKGAEGMLNQLRGKVFWPWMAKQAQKLVNRCEPCMKLARSNTQETVEVKHTKLFNTHPGHTVHADFFELNSKDYIILVDRLTGFARCEVTKNKGTDSAIGAIKNWGDLFGYPYKMVADYGPAFRQDFGAKLKELNISNVPTSAYHPQSNSMAERGVQSIKSGLKKSSSKLTTMHLNELVFAINTTASSEGTGSPADRFFGRSIRGRLPNSLEPNIKSDELIRKRILTHDGRIKNKNKKNKIFYTVGQRVRLQNIGTKDWDLKGTVERMRYTDDGRVVSYYVMTDTNNLTTRHRRYLKPLHPDHDPLNTDNIAHKNTNVENADLPNISRAEGVRRSARSSSVKSVTLSSPQGRSMGAELSAISNQAPLSVNFELTIGPEEIEKVKEFWEHIVNHGEKEERHGHASTRVTGSTATWAGGAGARAGIATGGHGGLDIDSPGCSSDSGPIRHRNVKFTKAGHLCRGHRKFDKSHGLRASEKTTETITINDLDTTDEEVERMEKRLARLLECKYKRNTKH